MLLGFGTSAALASHLWIAAVVGIPQLTPYSNGTRQAPSLPTSTSSCNASCGLFYPYWGRATWKTLLITTTITAATVIIVVNDKTNTTRTSTIYNDLPSGYTLPDTNDAGTVVTTLVMSDYIARTNYSTVVAYPTEFTDDAYFYEWYGVLPTSTSGQSTCVTVKGGTQEILPSRLPPLEPLPSSAFPKGGDKLGMNARMDWKAKRFNASREFYESAYPDEAAFRLCRLPTTEVPAANAWQTATFLTETSVSHEENQTTEASTTQDPSSGTATAPPTVDASFTPAETSSSSGLALPTADPASTFTGSPSASALPSPMNDASSTPAESSSSSALPLPPVDPDSTGTPSPGSFDIPSPTVDANPTPAEGPSSSDSPSPTVDANPAPTEGPSSSEDPPSTVNANLTPAESTGSSNLSPALQGSSSPAWNPSVNTPSETLEPSPVSVTTQDPDVEASSPFGGSASPSPSPLEAAEDSPTSSAVISESVPQAPASPPSENGSAPLPNQIFTDSTPALVPPLLTIGDSTYTANSATEFQIGPSVTIAPGGPAQPVSGTTISLAPSASYIAINDATSNLPAVSLTSTTSPAYPVLTISGSSYTANSASEFEIGPSITIAPGGPAQVISGTTISLAPSASYVAINGAILSLEAAVPASPNTLAPPVLTMGGNTYSANSATQYEVAPGITAVPGGPAQIMSGTTISIAPSASYVVINGATLRLEAAASTSQTTFAPPVLTIGDKTYIANSATQYEVAPGITVALGGPAQAISGTTMSLAPSASYIAVNGANLTLEAVALTPAPGKDPTTRSFGGNTYTAHSASQYVIEGQTLGLGSSITIGSGSSVTVVELRTAMNGATEVIVGAGNSMSTSTLTSAGAAIALPVPVPTKEIPPLTLAGITYSADSLTQYSLALSLTLTPGGVVTLSGTPISLETSASFVVIGSSTETLSAPATSMTKGTDISTGLGGSVTGWTSGGNPINSSILLATASGGSERERRNELSIGFYWISLIGMIIATGYLGLL